VADIFISIQAEKRNEINAKCSYQSAYLINAGVSAESYRLLASLSYLFEERPPRLKIRENGAARSSANGCEEMISAKKQYQCGGLKEEA